MLFFFSFFLSIYCYLFFNIAIITFVIIGFNIYIYIYFRDKVIFFFLPLSIERTQAKIQRSFHYYIRLILFEKIFVIFLFLFYFRISNLKGNKNSNRFVCVSIIFKTRNLSFLSSFFSKSFVNIVFYVWVSWS